MKRLFPLILLGAADAYACPFCDFGATDTATFILTLFGLFVLGMAGVFLIFSIKGGWKESADVSNRVLEIEKGDGRDQD